MIYWILGIFSGLLSGFLGIGGGLLITPALIFIFQHQNLFPNHVTQAAVGSSLAVIAFTAFSSMIVYQRKQNIDWQVIKYLLPGLVCAPIFGAMIATSLPSNLLARLLGIVVIVMAIQLLFQKTLTLQIAPKKAYFILIGISAGLTSGIIGIGGGLLLIPLLSACGLSIRKATGTGVTAGFFCAVSGVCSLMVIHHFTIDAEGYIFWPGVLRIAPSSMLFAWIAASIAHKLPAHILSRIFAIFLMLMSTYLILKY